MQGERADALVAAIKQVLRASIDDGGSTLRDHVQPDGELGYFQHRFEVYDREGAACPTRAAAASCAGRAGRPLDLLLRALPALAKSGATSDIGRNDVAAYENILAETQGRVGIIRLNRPKALNALSPT